MGLSGLILQLSMPHWANGVGSRVSPSALNTQGIRSCLEHESSHPGTWPSLTRTKILTTFAQKFPSKTVSLKIKVNLEDNNTLVCRLEDTIYLSPRVWFRIIESLRLETTSKITGRVQPLNEYHPVN